MAGGATMRSGVTLVMFSLAWRSDADGPPLITNKDAGALGVARYLGRYTFVCSGHHLVKVHPRSLRWWSFYWLFIVLRSVPKCGQSFGRTNHIPLPVRPQEWQNPMSLEFAKVIATRATPKMIEAWIDSNVTETYRNNKTEISTWNSIHHFRLNL